MNGIPDFPPFADDSSDVDCVLDSDSLQEQRLAVVLDWLQQNNARSVLDLGCGSGDLLAYLDDLS